MRKHQLIILLLCAWVLWHEKEFTSFGERKEYRHWWDTPTAYSSKGECEAAQARVFGSIMLQEQEMADSELNKGKAEVKSVPNRLVIFSRQDFSSQQRLTCLPDTVNPQ